MIPGQPSSRSSELIKVLATADGGASIRNVVVSRAIAAFLDSFDGRLRHLDPRRHPRTYEQAPRHYHRQIQDDIRSR
jgi:hypothetical protein